MKKVFRSIIDIQSSVPMEELVRNYRAFITSRVQAEDPSYIKLYHWIEAHFREYKEIPSYTLLYKRAEKEGNEGVLVSLRDLVSEVAQIRSNYKEILKDKFEEQCKNNLQDLMQKTYQIASSGLKTGKKEIKGIESAIEYFISESRNFRMRNLNTKTEGNIRTEQDRSELMQEYQKSKTDHGVTLSMYSFLDKMDSITRGLKPGELMLVAGFVKHGKTILATNLAYNGIVQGLNGMFVSLEMSFEEMRRSFYTLHTCNPYWLNIPKYKNLIGKIDIEKIIGGELSELEHEFYDTAGKHFINQPDYGQLYMYQPIEDLTPSRLESLAYDYDSQLKDQGKQLDFLVVDYVGLMHGDKSGSDWNNELNEIIKKLKNLALGFDNGRKIRIISPFQINRTGYKEAEKTEGMFKLTALSNANEAERSADVVVTTYMTEEMKKAKIIK